jgi:hypothetical protein
MFDTLMLVHFKEPNCKMRKYLKYILIFVTIQVNANMSEPVDRGTILSRPFVNEFVDIIHEDLRIKVDSIFNTARFEITYLIRASKDGIKIPFLFYAAGLRDDFKIYIDNKQIKLSEVPDKYNVPDSTKFSDFSYFFSWESFNNDKKLVLLEDSPSGGFYLSLNDFLYFETDISKGEHKITASYIADKWQDGWGWVNEYSFRYALSPAKYWKSFGSLTITIDATEHTNRLTTNIGEPTRGDIDKIAIWEFDTIPTEILKIIYKPEISEKAQTLIKIRPDRLAFMVGIVMLIIHLILIFAYRRTKPNKRFSWIVISGSIIFPLIFFYSWSEFYTVIDNVIGEHASREHGYAGLEIILYPIVMPIYWVIMWLIDRFIKRHRIKTHYND